MALITYEDLDPFAEIDADKAQHMIADATALAALTAPCLADESSLTPAQVAAAKAVLRSAILRWEEAGTGARSSVQQAAGNFQISESFDTRQPRRTLFQPAEIEQLQAVCAGDSGQSAFVIDTAPVFGDDHAEICSLRFGATYCSCGADLGVPQ